MTNLTVLRADLARVRDIDRTNNLASQLGTSLCMIGLAIAATGMTIVALM